MDEPRNDVLTTYRRFQRYSVINPTMKPLIHAAVALLVCVSAAHGEEPSFSELNGYARQLYARARDSYRDTSMPVIVLAADKMILIRNGKREEHGFVPDLYTVLKVVDHVPLGIFSLLSRREGAISATEREGLQKLKVLVEKCRPDLSKITLDEETMNRQTAILNQSTQFIDNCLTSGSAYAKDLRKFCGELSPILMRNADDAIGRQLADLDEQVTGWRKKMTPEEWRGLRVVIISGHMPREQNSHFQYFSKLLKEKREGDRIVYGEGLTTEEDGLNLLATHLIDERIARDFFSDRWRMHRDLLSDGAARYLKKHPPK